MQSSFNLELNRNGVDIMYSIGSKWKFETKKGMWYTGEVIAEDTYSIKIKTIRNETLILSREDISQAKELNSTEGEY